MNPIIREFSLGGETVRIETGRIARQADGAALVSIGDTVVLTTAVGAKAARPGQPFFPLTVNYQEKTYSAGRIPGGFFRREGRPTEKETLTSRLIDRPIRPLFPKGFMNNVQVIATVLSADPDKDPDIAALIGASAALALSGIPFSGPIGAARVGYLGHRYTLNPSYDELANSALNMVVAGTQEAVLMVESQARELSEDQMLGAVLFAHQEMQPTMQAIRSLAEEAGKPAWDWSPEAPDEALAEAVSRIARQPLEEAFSLSDKMARQARIREVHQQVADELGQEQEEAPDSAAVSAAVHSLEKDVVRSRVLNGEPRVDNRARDQVRPISVSVGLLPRAHGSALFTRGETQAIVTATLGTLRDSALVESLTGTTKDPFLLHYNFPPFSVGETGMMTGPKRREIGHGRLARRGLAAVLPQEDSFPYTIRVVSEITESNGSSSMASVCGSSLALMDAGVPLTRPVAGVAMGLVKEGERHAVLTDILGDEDHLGDMDFKVAGTSEGVTALQMDIKITGVTEAIMEEALKQALNARLHILNEMNQVLSASRAEISPRAPAMTVVNVARDKIRDVIGKGGATIRSIVEETGAEIDIEDDGAVRVYAADADAMKAAVARIEEITAEAEVGKIYNGKVARILEFGAFVNILPGKDGLVHISQIAHERVENVNDYLQEGQNVDVVVLDIDQRGRIKLSMKEVGNYAQSA